VNLKLSFQKSLNWCLFFVAILIVISLVVISIAHILKKPDYLPLDKAPEMGEKYLKKEPLIAVFTGSKDSLILLSQLEKWRKSQRQGNLSLYLSTYSVVQFKWSGGNYITWRVLKARSFDINKKFDIKIKDIKIQSNGKRAISSFTQFLDIQGELALKKKVLYWIKDEKNDRENWLIYKEKENEL